MNDLRELVDRYAITVFWSREDEAYIAICSDFPGLSAFGDSPEDALREGRDALAGHIESYVENGRQLPQPRSVAA